MKTVPLGSANVEVSAICLSTMHFDTEQDEATSFELLDRYVEAHEGSLSVSGVLGQGTTFTIA